MPLQEAGTARGRQETATAWWLFQALAAICIVHPLWQFLGCWANPTPYCHAIVECGGAACLATPHCWVLLAALSLVWGAWSLACLRLAAAYVPRHSHAVERLVGLLPAVGVLLASATGPC